MDERKMFKVAVTEILRKIVSVEAKNEEEARRRISDAWNNGEFHLGCEDAEGVEFYVLGDMEGTEADKFTQVERKDW